MRRHTILAVFGILLLIVGFALVSQPTVMAQEEEVPTEASVPAAPEFMLGYYEAWLGSGHADVTAEAFNHWNAPEDEGLVSERCAKCHSTSGYVDYMGDDGSEFRVVDAAAPIGEVVTCDACHTPSAAHLESVVFPSGIEVAGIGDSTRCMECHQGRESGMSVTEALEANEVDDLDVVVEGLRFLNIHYYPAAATLFGTEVNAGYEYEGMRYQMRFPHAEGYDTCIGCHNPHTLELRIDECSTCHEDLEDMGDLEDVRMNGSMIDYDGDGDIREGIMGEIETLQEALYEAIQAYAAEVIGTPIVYDAHAYPYFFADTDGDGEGDERYSTFTGRLVQASFNYQMSMKDPGNFAHNAKYTIELLYDSIASLNEALMEPVDMSMMHRDDPGHFNSTEEAFRHWDEDGEVSGRCTRCHTADGLPFYLEHGVNISGPVANEITCTTCHAEVGGDWMLHSLAPATFPSGAEISFGEDEPGNLCMNCHQGRDSGVGIAGAIDGLADDEVSESLRFRNPHYFAAGATLFGAEANGAYQYPDMDYSGNNPHTRRYDTCVDCHGTHSLEIDVEECIDCHEVLEDTPDVSLIRLDDDYDPVDYDGDGDVEEPIAAEIASYHDALYAAIQAYAADTIGTPIVYDPHGYPYWFTDEDGDGVANDRYGQWTPRLLRAVYNYTWYAKDTGAYAHNPDYMLQVLYDSIMDIGGEDAVADFTRAPNNWMDED